MNAYQQSPPLKPVKPQRKVSFEDEPKSKESGQNVNKLAQSLPSGKSNPNAADEQYLSR
jgi:hypothetical protein